MVTLSRDILLDISFLTRSDFDRNRYQALQPHYCNGCRLSHNNGLGCSPFTRRYSGNNLFSSGYLDVSVHPLTFHLPIDSAVGSHQKMWGYPIRRSPDQSLFVSSPEHIADYHVLHRLLVPRHPPYALSIFSVSPTN